MKTQTEQNTVDIKNLKDPSFRQDIFHPSRILYAIIFGTIFFILGYYIPRFYLQYFDNTEYYFVEQPVVVDKHIYKPCEKITVTVVRTSWIDTEAHSVVQLYLVNGNSLTKIPPLFNDDIIIDKTKNQPFNFIYTLPCDLLNGKYYIQAFIKYNIKGIEQTYLWKTVPFSVEI